MKSTEDGSNLLSGSFSVQNIGMKMVLGMFLALIADFELSQGRHAPKPQMFESLKTP